MPSRLPLVAVVDDEPDVRRALQRLLRSAGFAVETYATGAAFLDDYAAHAPDCVLLDLHMPGCNGFEVQVGLARIGADVPVVMITGNDAAGARAQALANGATAYLCKPMDASELLAVVSRAVVGPSAIGAADSPA